MSSRYCRDCGEPLTMDEANDGFTCEDCDTEDAELGEFEEEEPDAEA